MNITVIMPCFLGDYPGASKDRDRKFIRAVNSFIENSYPDKNLVIVSDGCKKTWRIYNRLYVDNKKITCITIPKQPLFSGNVRQSGINYAIKHIKPDIIVPLDSDDYILPFHLEYVNKYFSEDPDLDFIYCDEYYLVTKKQAGAIGNDLILAKHPVELQKNVAGTSSVVWRNKPEFSWSTMDGWGHDYKFIELLIDKAKKFKKVDNLGYVICHIKGYFDN